jgi:Family of unknown function (DUF6502)
MQTVPVSANDPLSNALNEEQRVLLDALDGVLAPLADLCLAKGLTIQSIEERLRQSFVQSAVYAHGGLPSSRLASRISASTGLTRREVARLQAEPGSTARREPRRSPATELFTRWICDPSLRDENNQPRALPRLGTAPSFERLAQSVTQDIHPRSLLDELCRLGLAVWDTDTDEVQLVQEAFVPRGDWARMTSFLADTWATICAPQRPTCSPMARRNLSRRFLPMSCRKSRWRRFERSWPPTGATCLMQFPPSLKN